MAAALLVAAAAAIARRSVNSSITSSSRCYLLTNNSSHSSSSTLLFCNPIIIKQQLLHFFSTKTPSPTTSTPQIVFTQDYFVSKYQFSPQIASKLASASARMRNPQNPDLLLSYLQQTGFSNAHLERIVKHHPLLLSTSPEKSVKPKLKIFHDLGFSADEAAEIIARNLTILHCQPKRIMDSLDVYRRLLGSNDHVIKLIKKKGSLLYADPEKTILPNIQFLKTYCGVQLDRINGLICTMPYFFLISPENMRRCVHKVDEMGVDRTSKAFIYAAWTVCTMSDETLKLKLNSFQDLGFSEDDILRVFRSAPMVIAVSTRKLKEVKEVLLETGKYDMSCIIKNPTSLLISVEKRYKPRLQVLKTLERKGLIDKWPTFSTLFGIPNKNFFERFVAPNMDEVGEDFIAKTSVSGKLEMPIVSKSKLR